MTDVKESTVLDPLGRATSWRMTNNLFLLPPFTYKAELNISSLPILQTRFEDLPPLIKINS